MCLQVVGRRANGEYCDVRSIDTDFRTPLCRRALWARVISLLQVNLLEAYSRGNFRMANPGLLLLNDSLAVGEYQKKVVGAASLKKGCRAVSARMV